MLRKGVVFVTGFLVLVIVFSVVMYEPKKEDTHLFLASNRKPEVLESLQYEHKNPNVDLTYWFAVAHRISSLNRTGVLPYLQDILVQYYPDWINGTAYIAMTDTSNKYTELILEQFSAETQIHIKFIKAPAPLRQIREWEQKIWEQHKTLKDKGVMIWSSSIYYDGRILLGIEDINPEIIQILCETLKGVPLGVIVIHQEGPIILI